MMLINGTMPAMGVSESWALFTAPQLASVVTVVNSVEFAMPKRTSLPSMFPPDCVSVATALTPLSMGLPRDSEA
jgi:hypothetical protein